MTANQLQDLAHRFNDWLRLSALPLWWDHGADLVGGGFHELLGLDGVPVPDVPRRARVQSRQSYCYALAGELGWNGPWRQAAPHGIDYLIRHYKREDGQFCTLVSARGEILDSTTLLYDQAFALLAMAAVVKVLPERTDLRDMAHTLFARIRTARQHSTGGFVESGARRFISNPHMHLLEALLAWRHFQLQHRVQVGRVHGPVCGMRDVSPAGSPARHRAPERGAHRSSGDRCLTAGRLGGAVHPSPLL